MEESKTEYVNVIDFLNSNNIKYCPINLEIINGKKIFKNFKKAGESGIKRPDNGLSVSGPWYFSSVSLCSIWDK